MPYKPGFWSRGAAIIYDLLFTVFPLLLMNRWFNWELDPIWFNVFYMLYASLLPYYFNGKTIGKQSLIQMFTRCFVFLTISYIIFRVFYFVSIAFVIFRNDKRALHDLMAGTKIVAN